MRYEGVRIPLEKEFRRRLIHLQEDRVRRFLSDQGLEGALERPRGCDSGVEWVGTGLIVSFMESVRRDSSVDASEGLEKMCVAARLRRGGETSVGSSSLW